MRDKGPIPKEIRDKRKEFWNEQSEDEEQERIRKGLRENANLPSPKPDDKKAQYFTTPAWADPKTDIFNAIQKVLNEQPSKPMTVSVSPAQKKALMAAASEWSSQFRAEKGRE